MDAVAEGSTVLMLRREAEYWHALHGLAAERAEYWKETATDLKKRLRKREALIAKLVSALKAAKARIRWLDQQLFGRKSERREGPPAVPSSGEPCTSGLAAGAGSEAVPETQESKDSLAQVRRRGKQPGTKGYGRKRREELPSEEHDHDLPEDQKRCPICRLPFLPLPDTEDSELIDWEVRITRHVHRRKQYFRTCTCNAGPKFITAPGPAKLIPKGLFTNRFWVHLLLEKYYFQRPLHRVRKVLALQGLEVSQGTLTGGLKRISELLQPVYGRILERSRTATRWQMDETRWYVWEPVEGKKGYRWWLWVLVTEETVSYVLDPSRSAEVPRNLLGDQAEGTLTVDRYSAYKALSDRIVLTFCWSHVRRDYTRVEAGYESERGWAKGWIEKIQNLFHLNEKRLEVRCDPVAYPQRDQELRQAVDAMAAERDRELADPTVHPAARRALKSLQKHWEGCTIFLDHPEVPMDNNECERQLRDPVVGRKNYYGSGSVWSATLTAILFTIFQTLVKNRVDPEQWLRAYFEACANNGGEVLEDIDSFLPWNLSETQKEAWALPTPFP